MLVVNGNLVSDAMKKRAQFLVNVKIVKNVYIHSSKIKINNDSTVYP